jgi:hypothetical protein
MPNEQADVFKTDQTIMVAGHYFNVKASRETKLGAVATMGDKEIGVEVPSLKKEGSFCIEGDWRVRQAYLRHRMEVPCNMSLSFNPATMMCMGCSKRGPHCVMGGENRNPIVLVASD